MVALIAALAVVSAPRSRAQELPSPTRGPFDQILDLYVRDGFVYYRALKHERAKLDSYIASLADRPVASAPRNEQIAFWINAYNAFVLRTVIDHYPIAGHSKDYPPRSVRQIPGAFERLTHHAAGRTVTLDQIENQILSTFNDPRIYFALGRGSVDGGRLHSETYTAARLEDQLAAVEAECASRQCVQVDTVANKVNASSIFSWHEKEFADAFGPKAPAEFANRSPIERAVIAYVEPKLLTAEKQALAANTFQVAYKAFDWSLNDLTGRGGR